MGMCIATDDRGRDACKIEKIQRTGNLQGCGSCDFKYEVKVWIVRSISMSQMDKVYIV